MNLCINIMLLNVGEEVPNWRYIKDQDWWIEYLKSLGIDPRNP